MPQDPTSTPPDSDRLGFWLQTQQHIHENIKFADTKAAQLIAIDGALLGALYAIADWANVVLLGFGLLATASLALAIAASFKAVWPRGEENMRRGEGVVDAIRIRLFPEVAFMERSAMISHAELLDELREFVYDRSCIDHAKYHWLQISFRLSCMGWIVAFVVAIANRLSLIKTLPPVI
jgi:hypothetical protein